MTSFIFYMLASWVGGIRGGDAESVSVTKSLGGHVVQNMITTEMKETRIYPTRTCRNFPNLMRLLDNRHKNHAIPSLINHYHQTLQRLKE
jgi:hypothetical protein